MAVTLTNLISYVREYTSMPDTTQISDDDITTEINWYYQNVMPLQIELPEFQGSCTLTTSDEEASQDLPAATLKVSPPVRIGAGASPTSYSVGGFYYESALFHTEHNGSETKSAPVDILLLGRTVYYGPTANGVYKIVFPNAVNKPDLLEDGDDEITQDRLRDLIASSASVLILSRIKDDESMKLLLEFMPFYVQVLKSLGIDTNAIRMLEERTPKPLPKVG